MKYLIRVSIAVLFVFLALFGAYIAGFNFDERGSDAFITFVVCVMAFVLGATCPIFDDWNN